ncbi:MAG: hypothetical protein ABJB74_12870 [Gemmatimonas sp.]
MISVIKTAAHHSEILERVSTLVDLDPIPESPEGKELEVLTVLLKDYERREFPLAPPSPLAAIRLRMDQMELSPKDLIPFLGARSRVSEVLSGKRPLSLAMIRALHEGLRIPLESLVADSADEDPVEDIQWDRFPVQELVKRGWISNLKSTKGKRFDFSECKTIMEGFFRPIGGLEPALGVLHKTDHVRTAASSDRFALAAWAGYVQQAADELVIKGNFDPTAWGPDRLRELRNLSQYDVGPKLATQFLSDRGIAVVIAPHLQRTRLDGAAMLRTDGAPVIALTIRHDRVDNFWFTLFHELMHVLLHLWNRDTRQSAQRLFLDDLDVAADSTSVENEADDAARQALVPLDSWNRSAVRFAIAPATVTQLANELGVSSAIVAGRVRFERRNYRLLSGMVGAGQVRSNFPEVKWSADD